MLEVIYRVYEVCDELTQISNQTADQEYNLYQTSGNTELIMDCKLCENRNHFKELIKSEYGDNIAFRNSKKLKPGDLYCIIIGEHCYNTQRYFNEVTFRCDNCNTEVKTYYGKPIAFTDSEIKYNLFGIQKYASNRFCSYHCKNQYLEKELPKINPDAENEFYILRDMFSENIAGYVYKITKKSTGEFYVGKTVYAPVFRWGQHLKTERFPISEINDYCFETIEIVKQGDNILEREKYWIQKLYKENPSKSLNIACTANLI